MKNEILDISQPDNMFHQTLQNQIWTDFENVVISTSITIIVDNIQQ